MKNIIKEIGKFILRILSKSWFMYDPDFEIEGEKWRLHKVDADQNFPSVPHMDCITNPKKKMNIYTGEIFIKGNKKSIEKASKKEMQRLWAEWEFREIVYDERIRYFKKYEKEYKENIPEEYVDEYTNYKK